MERITKKDLRWMIDYINDMFIKYSEKIHYTITFSKKRYTPNIVEIRICKWKDEYYKTIKFKAYREARYYLHWIQDWFLI